MGAVLDVHPIGVECQPIEKIPVSIAELLHERVVIAAAENEKWPVKSWNGKIVKPTVETQSGFDARFLSACRGAGSAAPRMAENTNMIQIQPVLEHRIFRIPACGFVQHETNILSRVGDNG